MSAVPRGVDWNNDGRKDLVVGNGAGEVWLLLNVNTDADPVFAASVKIQDGGADLDVGSRSLPVAVDWSEDGAKDLLVGASMGVRYYENLGTDSSPVFDGYRWLPVGTSSFASIDTPDWNDDGCRDIIIGDSAGDVLYCQGEYGFYPDLSVSLFAGPAQGEWNEPIDDRTRLTIFNSGTSGTLSEFCVGLYLSDDTEITKDDHPIGNGVFWIQDDVGAGTEYSVALPPIKIPITVMPGSYYFGVLLDVTDRLMEPDESNNTACCPIQINPTEPVADVEANGSDIAVAIDQGDSLTVDIVLHPNNGAGSSADWWVVVDSALGWYRYSRLWEKFVPGLAVTYQGPLFALGPYTVFSSAYLPPGDYTFHFGVDGNMNGVPDLGQMYHDTIDVTVR